MQLVSEHMNCRLCGSSELYDSLNIGNQYVNNFVKEGEWSGIYCPLEIVHCRNCDLYQLRHTAPQELLYKGTYWYKSGVTDFMVNHLRELACDINDSLRGTVKAQVLDIGANDGTLLKSIDRAIRTVGVEPATNLYDELSSRCDVALKELWTESKSQEVRESYGQFDFVTAIGMFYDLDDPIDFVKGVAHCLKDDGTFIAQLMCMKNMLDTNDLGNICHEHIEFYTLRSLDYLFRKCKLRITKIETNAVNGQSYRVFAKKELSDSFSHTPEIQAMIENEDSDIRSFESRINHSRSRVVDFIKRERSAGKKIAAFGASTKGNCILQYFGLSYRDLAFAVDRSPWKEGLYTIGSWVPIKHEDDPSRFDADYYLVLPWGFMDEFLKRERRFLHEGGKFIVPFPTPRIIDLTGEVEI